MVHFKQNTMSAPRLLRVTAATITSMTLGVTLMLISPQIGNAETNSGICTPLNNEGLRYIVCTVNLTVHGLKLFWKGRDDKPYRRFERLIKEVTTERILFAMNAGIFEERGNTPTGLYVEAGRHMVTLNTKVGDPGKKLNFYRKPNGVFFVSKQAAAILETERYMQVDPQVELATQSGPLLVNNGDIPSDFIRLRSTTTMPMVRSGVGVCVGERVVFVISISATTFYEFAQVYRDRLGCPNALYLDGGRHASLYAPALNRADVTGELGPIVAAVKCTACN